ncbi:hypothetical protein PAECIP112173_02071 [Paenibacillus sp. JJ-100]|uniref:hypothetical protein n=1 Tax=Paenibacillus sp. JJ-100 TaxID=2974896 RepID=UPI0022FF80BA|nr:hypothetical protein [Paenibacillus sp. JJ-100]CAI6068287.1 hypothetical protein PAECIP112173_02071 [Paenibacillus sp. JJ-100]
MSDFMKIILTSLMYILICWLLFLWIRKQRRLEPSSRSRNWIVWFMALFIVGAAPLAFAWYTYTTDERLDANIGLGLAMLFAWAYCALLLCGVIGVWARELWRRNKKH